MCGALALRFFPAPLPLATARGAADHNYRELPTRSAQERVEGRGGVLRQLLHLLAYGGEDY
jgi:hypothetical protein